MYVPDAGKDDIPEFSGINQWSSDITGRVGGHNRGGHGRHDGTSGNEGGGTEVIVIVDVGIKLFSLLSLSICLKDICWVCLVLD